MKRAPEKRRRGRPAGTDYFTRNPDVADAVEAWITQRQLAAPRIMELLAETFPQMAMPGIATLRRFLTHLETSRPALLASFQNPDGYKSQYRLALGRADGGVSRAHQVWEIDTTKSDVMCKGGKVHILGLVDRYSRMARFMVAPSESGQSVRRLLIDAITAWGVVPEALQTDNGSGYINQSIVSALDMLDIEHRLCKPGSPESKPFIERIFGTFTRERQTMLEGFAGHSVADAQRIRAKAKKNTGRAVIEPALDAEQLQAILSAWVDGVYHQRRHNTTRQSPLQRAFMSDAPARRAPEADVLRMALSKAEGDYTVGKRGVNWRGGRYWSPALAAHVGRQVHVRRDEDDLGALLIFDEARRFIDVAINHARAGLSEVEFATIARNQQARWMADARAEVRSKQKRFKLEDAVQARLRADAEAANKLITLPRPTAAFSTPTLDSLKAPAAPEVRTDEELQRAAARIAPKTAARTVADKIAECDAILAAAARGEAVDDATLRRARAYEGSSEYRAEKMIQLHFAPRSPDQKRKLA